MRKAGAAATAFSLPDAGGNNVSRSRCGLDCPPRGMECMEVWIDAKMLFFSDPV